MPVLIFHYHLSLGFIPLDPENATANKVLPSIVIRGTQLVMQRLFRYEPKAPTSRPRKWLAGPPGEPSFGHTNR